jgi:thiol:disulfide interchange protein
MPPADGRGGDSRRAPRELIALALVLLGLRVAVTLWEDRHPPMPQDHVRWVPLPEAESVARTTGKPVLYDFSAEWCGPCQAMKREVFAQPARANRIDAMVVPVPVVDRAREEGRNPDRVDSLQRAFQVTGFPTLVVYSPETGRHASLDGYRGADATMSWLGRSAFEVRSAAGVPLVPGH